MDDSRRLIAPPRRRAFTARLLPLLMTATAGLAGLSVTASAQAQAARYEIDPEHFSVGFLVERFINWAARNNGSVVWANVNWNACES